MSDRTAPVVGVIMGSDSDLPVMQAAADALTEFEIGHEVRIISAHRRPIEGTARRRCSRRSACFPNICADTRTSSPAGSGSDWAWPGRSRWNRSS